MAKEAQTQQKAPAAQKPAGKGQAREPRKGGGPAAAGASVAKGRPKGTGETKPRLKEMYTKTIVQAVMKERGFTNPFQVLRLALLRRSRRRGRLLLWGCCFLRHGVSPCRSIRRSACRSAACGRRPVS